jgi:pimeloyl-ACP methyl ester carboxylesterase
LLRAGGIQSRSDALTIVLVPGWSMPADILAAPTEELGKSYRVLAFEPRGQASPVTSAGYTAERRATDLKEFLESLSNVLLVGWSLGAIESLQYIHMFETSGSPAWCCVDSSVGEMAAAAGWYFLQALRDDRDKTLEVLFGHL